MTKTIEQIKQDRRRTLALCKSQETTRRLIRRADEHHAVEEMRNLAYDVLFTRMNKKIETGQLRGAMSILDISFSSNNEAHEKLRLVDVVVQLSFTAHHPIVMIFRFDNHQLIGDVKIEGIVVIISDNRYSQNRFDDALIFAEERYHVN